MTDLDHKLRQALREQFGSDEFDDDRDTAVIDLVIDTFRGRNRWLTYLGVAFGITFMALAVLFGVKFFQATETRDMLFYAFACLLCFNFIAVMKVWFWTQMDKNAILRELKRVELQIARLASLARDKA